MILGRDFFLFRVFVKVFSFETFFTFFSPSIARVKNMTKMSKNSRQTRGKEKILSQSLSPNGNQPKGTQVILCPAA